MNLIQNTILTSLPGGTKKTPSGWLSFNAPCCVYNGESADKKKRGGIMTSADGTVSYHCFNCGFKASYVIGRKLSHKMRQFMGYIGIPEDTIRKLAIEAMREEEGDIKYEKKKFVTFKKKQLPKWITRIRSLYITMSRCIHASWRLSLKKRLTSSV